MQNDDSYQPDKLFVMDFQNCRKGYDCYKANIAGNNLF